MLIFLTVSKTYRVLTIFLHSRRREIVYVRDSKHISKKIYICIILNFFLCLVYLINKLTHKNIHNITINNITVHNSMKRDIPYLRIYFTDNCLQLNYFKIEFRIISWSSKKKNFILYNMYNLGLYVIYYFHFLFN